MINHITSHFFSKSSVNTVINYLTTLHHTNSNMEITIHKYYISRGLFIRYSFIYKTRDVTSK